MKRTRLLIAGVVAAVALLALALGGVFSSESAAPLPAPPAQLVVAGRDAKAALATILQGFSTGDTAGFVQALERNVAKNPNDADSLTILGFAYQQRARETGDPAYYTLSERTFRRALEIAPAQPLVTTGLATLAVARHRFGDAERLARRALGQDPEDASAYGALGDALLGVGRYEEAFRAYDRMAVLSPGIASYARISHARELLGRPRAAVETLAESFELATGVPEHVAWAEVQLGNLYFNTGQLDQAEAAYRRGLDHLPGYVHAEAGLGRVEAARGEYATAIERLRRVVDVLPVPQYAILLGDVFGAAGRGAEAREAYALVDTIGRLLEANGVRTELQTALFDLDHGRDVEQALQRAREAHRLAPGVNADDVLAWALYKNGACEEARGYAVSALRLGTRDPLMLFHRGMIERCLGNDAAGRRFLREALAVNPSFSLLHAPVARGLAA